MIYSHWQCAGWILESYCSTNSYRASELKWIWWELGNIHNGYRREDPEKISASLSSWVSHKNYTSSIPIGSMYAIYGNMDPINKPQMLAYIHIYIRYMDPMGIVMKLLWLCNNSVSWKLVVFNVGPVRWFRIIPVTENDVIHPLVHQIHPLVQQTRFHRVQLINICQRSWGI
jgi:hypothetical protein